MLLLPRSSAMIPALWICWMSAGFIRLVIVQTITLAEGREIDKNFANIAGINA